MSKKAGLPTMKIDLTKRRTLVNGKHPLTYIQDGNGFDGQMNYLGRFDGNGDPVAGGRQFQDEQPPAMEAAAHDEIAEALESQTPDDQPPPIEDVASDSPVSARRPGRPRMVKE